MLKILSSFFLYESIRAFHVTAVKVSAAVKLWVKSAVFNAIYLLCVFLIQLFVCLMRRQPHGFLTLSMERHLLLGKGDVGGIFLGELKWALHLYDVSFCVRIHRELRCVSSWRTSMSSALRTCVSLNLSLPSTYKCLCLHRQSKSMTHTSKFFVSRWMFLDRVLS